MSFRVYSEVLLNPLNGVQKVSEPAHTLYERGDKQIPISMSKKLAEKFTDTFVDFVEFPGGHNSIVNSKKVLGKNERVYWDLIGSTFPKVLPEDKETLIKHQTNGLKKYYC